MNKNGYIACLNFFSAYPKLKTFCVLLQKVLEIILYIIYPLFLAYLIVINNTFWVKSAVICGVGLVAISILRARLNAKRPYEVFEFTPLIKKDKKGHSFPSRHVFSAAIISVNVGVVFPVLGIVFGVMTLIIAFLRVVLGVHFIKDVVFGAICGLVLGLTGIF